jgi:hypothetical protein
VGGPAAARLTGNAATGYDLKAICLTRKGTGDCALTCGRFTPAYSCTATDFSKNLPVLAEFAIRRVSPPPARYRRSGGTVA